MKKRAGQWGAYFRSSFVSTANWSTRCTRTCAQNASYSCWTTPQRKYPYCRGTPTSTDWSIKVRAFWFWKGWYGFRKAFFYLLNIRESKGEEEEEEDVDSNCRYGFNTRNCSPVPEVEVKEMRPFDDGAIFSELSVFALCSLVLAVLVFNTLIVLSGHLPHDRHQLWNFKL